MDIFVKSIDTTNGDMIIRIDKCEQKMEQCDPTTEVLRQADHMFKPTMITLATAIEDS